MKIQRNEAYKRFKNDCKTRLKQFNIDTQKEIVKEVYNLAWTYFGQQRLIHFWHSMSSVIAKFNKKQKEVVL